MTVPVSERFSIEGAVSARGASEPYYAPPGYYSIQVKQRIVRGTRNGLHSFFTYGAAGAYASNYFWAPLSQVIGGGIQQQLGSHVGLRVDAQLLTVLWIPLGARFTADISIPLGR